MDVHQKIVESLRTNGINERLRQVVREAYEATLAKHGIILHYAERDRLFARVMRSVLEEMLGPGRTPSKG